MDFDIVFQIWDFEDTLNYNMSQTKAHKNPLHCLDWSSGGHLVATAGSGMTVHVYRMRDGKMDLKLFELRGHLSAVVACQFSADATSLVSASLDTRVNIWDCLSGQLRQTLCHVYPVPQFIFGQAQVRSIGVTRFGGSIMTMTDEKKIQFWNPTKTTPDVDHPEQLPFRVTVPLLPLRVNSELTLELEAAGGGHSFAACKGGKWIGVSSNRHDTVRIYELGLKVPKLSDLCRNVVRKCIAFPSSGGGVDALPAPKAIKNFINYDLEKFRSHFLVQAEE